MTDKPDNHLVVETDDLIAQLSSNDCRVAERAFQELRRRIGEVKSRVYYAACREKDSNPLSYLVELLGESKEPKYFPFIANQLHSEHPRVRLFAHVALLRLGTPQSRELHYRCDLRKLLSDALRRKTKAGQRPVGGQRITPKN